MLGLSAYELRNELSRRSLRNFAQQINDSIELTRFHDSYYSLLDDFARGKIKKLIVSVPPQHGKSYGASTLLPAYLLGLNPELRICIASYSFSLARRFGASVRQTIQSSEYQSVFEATKLKGMSGTSRSDGAQLTTEEIDIVGHKGGLKVVGREGSLTGARVDVMILDDMYKDAGEANSPLIRENVWAWYTSVVRTRLHNNSQELIVFTRWHEDDLIGRLLKSEGEEWRVVNFEAIKDSNPTPLDPRSHGEVLWEERHSKTLLLQKRRLDPVTFESMYQGNPTPVEGLLYGQFMEYDPAATTHKTTLRGAYIDTADGGRDSLCAIAYERSESGHIYIVDVVHSTAPMEVTEQKCAAMLTNSHTQLCHVESNNGGRGFARVLQRLVPGCRIEAFHQSANKIARITSNATEVMRLVYMPCGWQQKWREFAAELTSLRRELSAAAHDDAADALTGIVEKNSAGHNSVTKIKWKAR